MGLCLVDAAPSGPHTTKGGYSIRPGLNVYILVPALSRTCPLVVVRLLINELLSKSSTENNKA